MTKIVFRLIGGLILIFVGGWILGVVFNLAALLSPQMVSLISCPPGSTAIKNWVQETYDQPGEKS